MNRDDVMRDTIDHVNRVGELLAACTLDLTMRAAHHDRSKFEPAEWPLFEKHTPGLSQTTYGSEEYRRGVAALGPAVEHHKKVNCHHPEYFEHGIHGMSLLDLIEMLCDWKAAGERHADGDIFRSIEINAERFGYTAELTALLINTAMDLWPDVTNVLEDRRAGHPQTRKRPAFICENCGDVDCRAVPG